LKLTFDNRGDLKPYKINGISIEEFRHIYVDAFSENDRRSELFKYYQKYTDDLSRLMANDFYQWIDGSYLSNKQIPRDIDVVSILHYQDYENDTHKKHIFTKSDLAYWQDLFSKTKVNRSKRQYPKGFIQINFSSYE